MRQTQGIYLISMVAETLDMHPQTLRKYERAGFVEPSRMGALRTYSDEDVARLRLIKHFVDDMGLNLAGVDMALSLTRDLLELRKRLSRGDGPSQSTAQVGWPGGPYAGQAGCPSGEAAGRPGQPPAGRGAAHAGGSQPGRVYRVRDSPLILHQHLKSAGVLLLRKAVLLLRADRPTRSRTCWSPAVLSVECPHRGGARSPPRTSTLGPSSGLAVMPPG